ncbi:MAG: TonB-dependent receptor [Acidobacteria bacterium]|nr:TonB-dependent receptor [Acidobacteriota bacterium]
MRLQAATPEVTLASTRTGWIGTSTTTTGSACATSATTITPTMWSSIRDRRMSTVERAGLQRYVTGNTNVKRGDGAPKDLGFSSTFVSQSSPFFPVFSFGGSSLGSTAFTGAGTGSGNFTPDQINNVDVTWSKIIGRHILKLGGQGRLERGYNLASGNNAGAFSFGTTATNADPQVSTAASGDAVASFLMGVGNASIDLNAAPARQSISLAAFVQDDISVTSKLKINLGLRWDWTGPLTDRYNAMTGIFDITATSPLASQVKSAVGVANCPACANLLGGLTFPGVGGQPRNVYDATRRNFSPRFGVAYALDSKTAIRGGFGMFYGPIWYDPGQAGFSQTTSSVLYDSNQIPINLIDNPFPTGIVQPTGSRKGLATNIGSSVSFVDPHTREPRSHQASVEIQREVPWGVLLSVGYTFNKIERLPVSRPLNIYPESLFVQGASVLNKQVDNPFAGLVPGYSLNQAKIAFASLQVPYPQFTSVTMANSPIGDSRYPTTCRRCSCRMGLGRCRGAGTAGCGPICRAGWITSSAAGKSTGWSASRAGNLGSLAPTPSPHPGLIRTPCPAGRVWTSGSTGRRTR